MSIIDEIEKWKLRGGYKGPYNDVRAGDNLPDDMDAEWRNQDGGKLGSCKIKFNVNRPEWPKHWIKEDK